MKRLGFAINRASSGAGIVYKCNDGTWSNKVTDIREYLKLFTGIQDTENVVSFMSFDENGCYLTQLRAISGRQGDFLGGWIFIPNTISISGQEVMSAYNFVRTIILQSNLDGDAKNSIESFFSIEYPQREFVPSYSATSGNKFGVRFIGMYTMEEILDTDRYQEYYSKYKAIFLLDKNGAVKISNENAAKFENLTNQEIEKYCVLKNPTTNALRALGQGTRVQYKNKDFSNPMTVKKGSRISLTLLRPGFEPQQLPPFTVNEAVQSVDLPDSIRWEKEINRAVFKVYDQKTKEPINPQSLRILVNNTDVTIKHCTLSEEESRNANITVSANGYEEVSDRVDFLNLTKNVVTIYLRKKKRSEPYNVVLRNGETAKMTIEGESIPSYDPLEGYEYDREKGAFAISQKFIWKQRLWGILGTLAAVLLIWLGVKIGNWWDNHEFQFGWPPIVETTQTQSDVIEEPVPADNDIDSLSRAAIEYMNNNEVWAKDALEEFPITQGLYDMINGYQFEQLSKKEISNCPVFDRIKNLSDTMCISGIPTIQGTYSTDNTITIEGWIKSVQSKKKDLTQPKSTNQVGATSGNAETVKESSTNESNHVSRITGKKPNQEPQKSREGSNSNESNKSTKSKEKSTKAEVGKANSTQSNGRGGIKTNEGGKTN